MNTKAREIGSYILPFMAWVVLSLIIEFAGNALFDTNILTVKYMLDLFISIVGAVAFVLTGYYIAPQNKKKTLKTLVIILCVLPLFAVYGCFGDDSILQANTYILAIMTAVIAYFIINKRIAND